MSQNIMPPVENVVQKQAETQKLLSQFELHRNFCHILQDAWVLVGSDGSVLKHNQMFCSLVGLKAPTIRKNPDIYSMLSKCESSDASEKLEDIVTASVHIRVDELGLIQKSSNKVLTTIVSNHPFFDDTQKHIGSCLMFRDVTAENRLQGKYTEKSLESILDPLTGLFSRRYLDQLMSDSRHSFTTVTKTSDRVSVLMCDIDFFKKVNDNYGHVTGDLLLVNVSAAIKHVCRSSDSVIRYGGEEFAVILPNTGLEGACIAAEKIRREVASLLLSVSENTLKATISIGASENLSADEPVIEILKRADACLYRAKETGRNRVIGWKDGHYCTADHNGIISRCRETA